MNDGQDLKAVFGLLFLRLIACGRNVICPSLVKSLGRHLAVESFWDFIPIEDNALLS